MARVGLALLLLLGACSRSEPRPNVVLVVVDTLRADHCSAYGYFRPTTPALEQLAAQGTLFERAWSQAPWTIPSMVSLLTGRYVLANYNTMPPDAPTLATLLKNEGYATAAICANPLLNAESGFARGFDRFEAAVKKGDDSSLGAREVMNRAEAWLTAELPEPFFAWIHLYDPHEPYAPPQSLASTMRALPSGVPTEAYRARQLLEAAQPVDDRARDYIEDVIVRYDGEVAFADAALGNLVAALDRSQRGARTIVVVTADHGEGLYDHAKRHKDAEEDPYGLYLSHGAQSYEEALHVPLVVRGPGFAAGRRVAGPVENVDLFPTLLAAAGAPADPGAPGVDLRAIDGAGKERVHAFGTREHALVLRSGMKLIHPVDAVETGGRGARLHLLAPDRGRQALLFDVSKDPDERQNLAFRRPDAIAPLLELMLAWQDAHWDALGDAAAPSDEMRKLLAELGYAH